MKIDDKALISVCRWAEHSGLDWNIAREVVMAYEAAKAPAAGQPVEFRTDARTIDQCPPEGQRTKENEWEACYAHLFSQMKPIMDENARLKRETAEPDKATLVTQACIESIIRRHATGWIIDKEQPMADYLFAKAEEMAKDILAVYPASMTKREPAQPVDWTQLGKANRDCVRRYRLLADIHNIIEKELVLGMDSDSEAIITKLRQPKRESVDRWQTMDTAPKDRAILLLIETCWLPLPWVGCWSYGREDWNVYLPFKTGDKNTTTYGFTPMGWMDIPKANEIEGQKPHG